MSKDNNKEGLGGWLILVGLGIVFSPLRVIAFVFPGYYKIFTNGSWEALTKPGAEAYHPLWSPILLGEIGINVMLVIAWLFIAFLFLSKNKIFPKLYIGIMVFTLGFIVMDALAVKAVIPNGPIFDIDTIKELAHSLIAVIIWVPYMLVSKRVKATFVN